MALGYLLMLFFLRFRSFLVLVIVFDQLVICTLQAMEIREIRRLLSSSQH
jgi:hypothetical protein